MATKHKGALADWPKVTIPIDPRLHRNIKGSAAKQGVTLKDWITEAIIRRLEDEIDLTEGLASLAEPGENIPWEQAKAEYEALRRQREVSAGN
ncbi:MAG: hypothetical protein HYY01_07930 [Chloroflexi bacterium]|nr:hypothetical protein [Chloroflexota bacterium]